MRRQVTLDSEQEMCFHTASQAAAKGACEQGTPDPSTHRDMWAPPPWAQ